LNAGNFVNIIWRSLTRNVSHALMPLVTPSYTNNTKRPSVYATEVCALYGRLSCGWLRVVCAWRPGIGGKWARLASKQAAGRNAWCASTGGFLILQFQPKSREAHCGSCSKRTLVAAGKLARQLTVTHVLCQPTVTRTSVHAARLHVVDVDFFQEPVWLVVRVVMRNSYLLQRTELWT